MKKSLSIVFGIALVVSLTAFAYGEESAPEDAIEKAFGLFQSVYSSKVVAGTPIEVNGLKLIPLATVGIGFGPYEDVDNVERIAGTGGVLMPVGVIVISGQEVRIVQLSKGFVEQIVSALAPVVLQWLNPKFQLAENESHEQAPLALQRRSGIQMSLAANYWKTMFIFSMLWLVLAFVIQRFFPEKVTAMAAIFRYNYLRISLIGAFGYGIVFLLMMICILSIIGIPFALAIGILAGIFTLFGTIGLALFVGQESATAFKYEYSDMRFMLIGGILFCILGMIPWLGSVVWALVSIFGFGATLYAQRENIHNKPL